MPAAAKQTQWRAKRSEISLLIDYCSPQGGFPMRVGDSSVAGGAGQFHTTRWTLVIASIVLRVTASVDALRDAHQFGGGEQGAQVFEKGWRNL